jgi:hypothetical protein
VLPRGRFRSRWVTADRRLLLVVATVSWLRVVAALAMLGAIALALPMLLTQKQPGE